MIAIIGILLLLVFSVASPLAITGNTLTVYVKDNGVPVSGATVKLMGPTIPAPKTTGAGGWAQFTDLDAGDYIIRVYTPTDYAMQTLTLSTTSIVTIDLGEPPIVEDGTGVIRGGVQSQDGNIALPNANVKAWLTNGYSKTVTSDSNGDYYLEVPEGTYSVQATASTGHTSIIKTISVITNGVTFSNFLILNAAATLTITVTDSANNAAISNAQLIMNGYAFHSDTGGIIQIDEWVKGVYEYVLSHPDYASVSGSLTVVFGANTFSLTMTPRSLVGFTVSGKALKSDGTTAVSGATISFTGASGTFTTQSLTDGRYSIQVPAGSYTVTASATGFNTTSYANNPLVVSSFDVSNVNIRMGGGVPPTDGTFEWKAGAIACFIGAGLVFVIMVGVIPGPPKIRGFLGLLIAAALILMGYMIATGVI